MHPNFLTWIFTGLFVITFIAWRIEGRPTLLHATVAESLGMFLFSGVRSKAPLGCAPSPEPRSLGDCPPGRAPVTFDFGEDRILCVVIGVARFLGKRKRLDLVLAPGAVAGALHVTVSADGRPPVFDGEVRYSEATKENPLYLGQP